MKKLIAMLLVMLTVVGMFAGCGPTSTGPQGPGWEGSAEAPYDVDPVTGQFIYGDTFKDVTVEWWVYSSYALNSDMFLFKKLEEVIGCKINLVRYDSQTFVTKINAALNSNDLPDICSINADHITYNVYGEQGAFVNLLSDAALARLPNMKKNVLDIPEAAETLEPYKSSSGALYSLPRYNHQRLVNHGWMYRKDIFEKHGIEMWHDSESFLNVLRKLKQLYPDSYPLTGANMNSVFERVVYSYGGNGTAGAYDWDKQEWYLGLAAEEYYEMMCLFQTAWEEDLVDPDIFSNEETDIDAAILNDESFVYNSWIGRMAEQNPDGKAKDPTFQVSFAPHIGKGLGVKLPIAADSSTLINAQSDSEVVDACLAIWNYLYSDEGAFACTVGEEGVTYTLNEDGSKHYIRADGTDMINPTIQTLEEEFGLWNSQIYPLVSRESVYFNYSPEEAEAQEIGSKNGFHTPAPSLVVPEEYGEEYSDLNHFLILDTRQFTTKFITDGYDRARWEAEVERMNTKYARLFEIANGNY